ncbi:uncharacterized protein EV422DRAFT_526695 [Fimicolochytrium jonesii]|uniref:uncharacterized protein n=1 Tax=Fimicolochytrium jonesii TaxID=1396493 RepID=UPI0022FDC892|nr:uncharacterized protein EV422DRAFT_526695 [Fimicolochytrium jonesii]KAI8821727.1 hypothetical protein EV422DRAFT_526695 [Fimicolochytrium jonesii]
MLGIFLSAGDTKNFTPLDWRKAVLAADPVIMTERVTTSLLENALTKDDIAALKAVDMSTGPKLAKMDLFLLEMMKIDRCADRLKAMKCRAQFGERCDKLYQDVMTAYEGFDALQTSDAFADLLELILLIGNYLNSGSLSGGAHGFRIKNINRLEGTKGVTKSSLLHFIADTVETKFPHMRDFLDDLKIVYRAQRIDLDALRQGIRDLRVEMEETREIVNSIKPSPTVTENGVEMPDRFSAEMAAFMKDSTQRYDALSEAHTKMLKSFEDAVVFYGEDPALTKPEDFLPVFTTFMDSYTVASAENKVVRDRKERDEKRRKAEEERLSKRRKSKAATTEMFALPSLPTLGAGDEGDDGEAGGGFGLGMDDLLESLKRGTGSGGGGAGGNSGGKTAPPPRRSSRRRSSGGSSRQRSRSRKASGASLSETVREALGLALLREESEGVLGREEGGEE